MAAVAPSADQSADLLQKLSLESQNKTLEITEPTKKTGSENTTDGTGNGQIQSFDRSLTPLLPDFMDPALYYGYAPPAYYYGGYDGTTNEWDYLNQEGVDMSHGVYGDNGLGLYNGYGYAPYGPYSPATSPVPGVGVDGQLYGAQNYQYPYFPPMPPTSGPGSTPVSAPPKGEISTSAAAAQPPLSVDTANGNSNGIANGGGVNGISAPTSVKPIKPIPYLNSSFNANASYLSGAQNAYLQSPFPWLDSPMLSDGKPRHNNTPITSSMSNGNGAASRNLNTRPHSHLMNPRPLSGVGTANGYMNRMYPNKLYGQYGSTYRPGYGYGSNAYDSRNNNRGWLSVDSKYKPRGRGNGFNGYGNENMDGLNELNRGPRAKSSKNQKGFTPIVLAVKGQNIPLTATEEDEKEKSIVIPDREQYNREDFPETYTDAKFYIIKSYSEDDVHKSVKYNVWSSTQNGNKKLDAAYQEAQQKSEKCPIFLFFSVNTSGQFVGVAEMVGPVDFNKSLEYWQQDKWIGCFPVKWHIVKDLPNSLLKHITLENNENKPVTNSRDTQEVKLEQGMQVLKIFKEHISKQCILDDFDFYEDRQKRIQEKKAKQQQFQKQVWEGKMANDVKSKENIKVDGVAHKSEEVKPDLVIESAQSTQLNGDAKIFEYGSVLKSGDLVKGGSPKVAVADDAVKGGAKPSVVVSEKKTVNGVANGY